jgi:hypothetical protein
MVWKSTRNRLEGLVEWGAPAVLAAAVGWSGWQLQQPLFAGAAGAICLLAGRLLLRRAGGDARPLFAFDPPRLDETGELLLDDPLPDLPSDSRVVRLFSDGDANPGVLVARIADYLADPGRAAAMAESPAPQAADGREALHAALANIRATLR